MNDDDDREQFEDLPILRELRERLEAHFAMAVEKPLARSPRRGWWRRRSRPLLVVVVALVAGGSAAAAVTLSSKPSQPLVGSVPPASIKPSRITEAGKQYKIVFVPELSGGEAGWTTFIDFHSRGQPAGGGDGGDAGYPTASMPLVGGSGVGFTSAPLAGGDVVDYVLTAGRVAAVRVGSTSIQTRTGPALPAGDRIAVFFVPAHSPPIVIPPPGARLPYYERVPVYSRPSRRSRGTARRSRQIEGTSTRRTVLVATTALAPLDGRGQVIPITKSPPAPLGPSIRAWQVKTPGQSHPGAAATHPLAGACELAQHGLPDLRAQWGHVVEAIQPVSDVEGELFLSCIDTEYYLHGSVLDAAILLDARHPGAELGPIPGATPVSGYPYTVNAVLGSPRGDFTARRVGNAWLVVQGGRNLDQRLEVLAALRISKLSLHGVPSSSTQTLASKARTCLLSAGFDVKAGPSPNTYNGYGLSIAAPGAQGAIAELYGSVAEAREHLRETIHTVRTNPKSHAKVELRGAATVIFAGGSTATFTHTVNRCLSG